MGSLLDQAFRSGSATSSAGASLHFSRPISCLMAFDAARRAVARSCWSILATTSLYASSRLESNSRDRALLQSALHFAAQSRYSVNGGAPLTCEVPHNLQMAVTRSRHSPGRGPLRCLSA